VAHYTESGKNPEALKDDASGFFDVVNANVRYKERDGNVQFELDGE
jgi:hypothetical protein